MNLYKINVKYKTMNLHSKFYILFVHNRKNDQKSDIRINIRIHPYRLPSPLRVPSIKMLVALLAKKC